MCGIVGYVGEKPAGFELLQRLKNMEYRGYDSAGVATISEGELLIRKGVGKLEDVQKEHNLDQLLGFIGIGHVRWATHGKATPINSHPHSDCRHKIAVVHNGIIENYRELRDKLEKKEHTFVSETDSEVIPHLIEDYMDTGVSLVEAVAKTAKQLKGSYAIIVTATADPWKLVGIRQDSPLVVGRAKSGNYFASDCLSLIQKTNEVAFLDDGEMAVLTEDSISFFGSEVQPLEKEFTMLDLQFDEVTKQDYDYFMLKEIKEQPSSICCALVQDQGIIQRMAMDILRARQVVLVGSGTSRHAALIGRYMFSKLAGKFCEVVMGSEFEYFSDSVDKNTLVIAVSQSGETADVIRGIKKAREKGATIFSLINMRGASLARISDEVLYLNCGPEISVAATKSFVSQLIIFYMLSFAMVNKLEEGSELIRKISTEIAANMRRNGLGLQRIVECTKDKEHFYYIARGINFATAVEGALKLKEISYIHAEGMPAGELKHGTLSLIQDQTPVLAICPKDYTFTDTINNIAEAKTRGACIIGVSDERSPLFDYWIEIPKVEEIFYPLVTIIPLQLLAYELAIARGLDPDRPRNLAKSVTVT